jgi:hypothetical protein
MTLRLAHVARTLGACALTTAAAVALAAQTTPQPAPRGSDGKPDLTGVYQASTRRGDWDAEAPGEQPGIAAPRRPGDVQAGPARDPIPFQEWARVKAQEYLDRRSVDDPTTYCIPQASPRTTPVGLFPVQFVQTPGQLVILYEYFGVYRVMRTDGRPHPDDIEPAFMGNSAGRWDGNTLVVDVVNFKEGGWLAAGVFHSDALHLVERYTRVDRDQLNYEVLIEDPKVFTKPWTLRATLMLRANTRIREYLCAENNLDSQRYQEFLKNPSLFIRKGQ